MASGSGSRIDAHETCSEAAEARLVDAAALQWQKSFDAETWTALNEAAISRRNGAVLFQQTYECATQRR